MITNPRANSLRCRHQTWSSIKKARPCTQTTQPNQIPLHRQVVTYQQPPPPPVLPAHPYIGADLQIVPARSGSSFEPSHLESACIISKQLQHHHHHQSFLPIRDFASLLHKGQGVQRGISANFCSSRSVLIPLQRHAPLKQSVIASTHTHTRTQYQPKHFLLCVYDTVSSDRCCRVSFQKTACQIQNGRDATSAFHLRIYDCPCKLIHLGARGCVYVCVWLRGLPSSNFTTAQQGPHTHHPITATTYY